MNGVMKVVNVVVIIGFTNPDGVVVVDVHVPFTAVVDPSRAGCSIFFEILNVPFIYLCSSLCYVSR